MTTSLSSLREEARRHSRVQIRVASPSLRATRFAGNRMSITTIKDTQSVARRWWHAPAPTAPPARRRPRVRVTALASTAPPARRRPRPRVRVTALASTAHRARRRHLPSRPGCAAAATVPRRGGVERACRGVDAVLTAHPLTFLPATPPRSSPSLSISHACGPASRVPSAVPRSSSSPRGRSARCCRGSSGSSL